MPRVRLAVIVGMSLCLDKGVTMGWMLMLVWFSSSRVLGGVFCLLGADVACTSPFCRSSRANFYSFRFLSLSLTLLPRHVRS